MKRSSILLFFALILITESSLNCCDENTVSVIGTGTIRVEPDIVKYTIESSGQGETSSDALSNSNNLLNRAINILEYFGLSSDNYSTTSFNLSPQYKYINGTSILIGQKASQSLEVTVGQLTKNKDILSRMIESFSALNSLTISGFTFSQYNSSSSYTQARKEAISDAYSKAQQYSTLSGLCLGNVKKVIDLNNQQIIPYQMETQFYTLQAKSLQIPFGKIEVSASVQVDWKIKE